MNTILRNFLSVLRRFKMATALNVLGLSVGFAAFMIIMMQVDYERGFDRMHPESGRIFRADLMRGDARMSIHARALVDAIVASSPRIERGALLNPFVGNVYVTVGEDERKQGFREPFVTCYPAITRIFGFSFTEGDADCLNDPDKLIIPQSMAQRMFGGAPALGRAIVTNEYVWTKGEPGTFTVGGVYRDFPDNTQLDNAVYTAIDRTFLGEWDSSNFICYLLLDGGASGEDVEGYINGSFDFSRAWNPNHVKLSISLTPLTGIYLS
ncbi:MAG: ABC transporter permease, partial [Tannerellaceae bacterium]|nr:ABC transporter permease [Tannerellaceae bacterium]